MNENENFRSCELKRSIELSKNCINDINNFYIPVDNNEDGVKIIIDTLNECDEFIQYLIKELEYERRSKGKEVVI